jgi:hypothetical protein
MKHILHNKAQIFQLFGPTLQSPLFTLVNGEYFLT